MATENLAYDLHRTAARALTTNSSASSFASKVYTVTEPSGNGIVELIRDGGGLVPQRVKLWPIGLGSENDAFSLRIIGWEKIGQGAAPATGWIPTIVAELACIVGTAVGVASSPVLNTERFADTITIVTEPTITAATTRQGTVELTSPTNDLIAHAKVWIEGFHKLEFTFDQTTGTPTMNVLFAFL